MTVDETKEIVRLLLAGYPTQRQRMSGDDVAAMLAAYQAGLGDLDADTARAAVVRAIRTSKFIPSIAEIRESVGAVVHGRRQTGLEAWDSVSRALRSHQRHTPGVEFHFIDPVTRSLVTPALWRQLVESQVSELVSHRARFVDAYDTAQARERVEAQASTGAVSKTLQGASGEAVKLLGDLSNELAVKFGGSR